MKKLILATFVALLSTQAMACIGGNEISIKDESGNQIATYDIRTGEVEKTTKSIRIEKILAVQSKMESDGSISTSLENVCLAEAGVACAEIKELNNAQVIVVYTEDGAMMQKTVKQSVIQSLSIGQDAPVAKCIEMK